MSKKIPDPPKSADSLYDVGNSCKKCGRNMGMFPVANVCRFCRKVKQPYGKAIKAIVYSPAGTIESKRVSNNSLRIDSDGSVHFLKGEHKDVTFLGDGRPKIKEDKNVAYIWLMSDEFTPIEYRIYFKTLH